MAFVPSADMFTAPSDQMLIRNYLASLIPNQLMSFILGHLSQSDTRLSRVRESKEIATKVARELIREKSQMISDGQGERAKDVMSLLCEHYRFEPDREKLF